MKRKRIPFRKLLPLLSLLAAFSVQADLSAVEPGGRLAASGVTEKAVPVLLKPALENAQYEIFVFFDALSPDAVPCLQMLDALPDLFPGSGKTFRVLAVARNRKAALAGLCAKIDPEFLSLYAENEKGEVFREFASGDVLIPFAAVAKDGKLLWKGAPSDLEGVLSRILAGKFSLSAQIRIELLRKELQSAVQAGLPEVILHSADAILAVDPADKTAIQAKLYVYDGRGDDKHSCDFLLERCAKTPGDPVLRLMLLNSLIFSGVRGAFRHQLVQSLSDFKANPEILARLLAFSLENAPLGWLPLKEIRPAAAKLATAAVKKEKSGRKAAAYCGILAHLEYLSLNIDAAICWQELAGKYRVSPDAKVLLEYYRAVKALKNQ